MDTKSPEDWLISITIEERSTVPNFDSLGRIIKKGFHGTYILSAFNGKVFLQQHEGRGFSDEYYYTMPKKRLVIPEDCALISLEAIRKADKESIYPFIVKIDSLNAYSAQQPSDHETLYGIYFKSVETGGFSSYFNEMELTEKLWFHKNPNLNYSYNVSTTIYYIYKQLLQLIEKYAE